MVPAGSVYLSPVMNPYPKSGGDIRSIVLALATVMIGSQRLPAQEAAKRPVGSGATAGRPNVVVILTDDQRWDCLGCADEAYLGIRTPNLDRLATEGARFRNMFVTTSLCSPSRASFLSGLYAHTHKVINNFTDFPADLPSYPRQLKAAGYETAYIGKFHMGEQSDERRPGFDYWVTHKGQGQYYDNVFNINGRREEKKGYYTTVVTDMAVDWLQRGHERPFLLILGHKAPHGPFVPEDKYKHLYDNVRIEYPPTAFALEGKPKWIEDRLDTWHGIYGPLYAFRKAFPDRSPAGVKIFGEFVRSYVGTIQSVDDSTGRILRALADIGQLDNTLVIFTSDNGFLLGEHGMIDKRTMHEESIRVPLLARWPKRIKPGTVVDEMVLNIDLAPTIVDLCNAEPLPKAHGRSWAALLDRSMRSNADREPRDRGRAADLPPLTGGGRGGGIERWRASWYYEYNYEKQFPYTPNVRGVRTTDWVYMHYPHGNGTPDRHKAELYNLKADPHEAKNLIDDPAYAGRLAELKAELERLRKECGALPDEMPLDEGVKMELPEKSIR
jgi:arylsulfatase A-like enzyme